MFVIKLRKLSEQFRPGDSNDAVVARLADLHERIGGVERRATGIKEQMQAIRRQMVDEREASEALSAFDPIWGALTPKEQARVITLLVEKVVYDGAAGKVAVTFHPTGIKALADELARQQQEHCA